MKPILFSRWEPDRAFYNQKTLYEAKNVIPAADGFRPLKSFTALSSALSERVRGGILSRGVDGNIHVFVGTASALYKYNSASASFTDISDTTYTAAADTFWSMCQYGKYVLMTNMEDGLREYDTTTLPATVSATAGSPPKARHVMVVKDHVVLCGLDGAESTIEWSAINDRTGWVIGTDLCDYQEFPDGGRVMAAHGGEYGIIMQERKIRLMQQAPGSPEIFQFDVIEENRGCAAPRASVAVGGAVFFLANDGFCVLAGNKVQSIADEKTNRWFFDNVNSTYFSRVVCGFDAFNKFVIWGFVSKDASSSDMDNYICDKQLIYHWPTGKWSYSDARLTTFIDANVGKTTLESLDAYGDLDSLPYSLDSAVYNADQTSSILYVFDENHKMGRLEGDPQEAFFEIRNMHLAAPHRQLIRGIMPICDAADTQVSIGGHERLGDAVSWNSYVTIESSGWSPQHDSARMHSVRIKIPSGSSWNEITGFYVDMIGDGEL